jgi:hypothetical protein
MFDFTHVAKSVLVDPEFGVQVADRLDQSECMAAIRRCNESRISSAVTA